MAAHASGAVPMACRRASPTPARSRRPTPTASTPSWMRASSTSALCAEPHYNQKEPPMTKTDALAQREELHAQLDRVQERGDTASASSSRTTAELQVTKAKLAAAH